jgi:D-arabinose 1-dehydrogenase-like Zn-dependent alcohol dehydrogenase
VLIGVHGCGVCRTDLHVVGGEMAAVRDATVPIRA